MDGAVQLILHYLVLAIVRTGAQLLLILGPAVVLATVLHYLSRYIRVRAARLMGLDAYTYVTAPGVMVHELGHAFFCVIFRHKIVRMRLFSPQADGTLGSVDHAYNPKSTYQKIGNFFIGTGPIWFGTAVIFLLSRYLLDPPEVSVRQENATDTVSILAGVLPQVMASASDLFGSMLHPADLSSWRYWLFIYLVFCIGSHITLSRSDIDGAGRGLFSLILFMLVVNLLTAWADAQYAGQVCRWLFNGGARFYALGLFVVCCNLGLAFIMALLSVVSRR